MKKTNYVLLVLVILFAVILNLIPHLNYQYPLHVDEWVHWQYASHLSLESPLYSGQIYQNNLEAGFHYFLATLNSVGIPYEFMFQFFASLILILTCLGIFILTRKMWNQTAALFSILFIALLQSSVAILGPVFLVPMALGLFFILVGLYLLEIKSNLWFIVLTFLLIMHPPTALAFFILINIKFLLNRKQYWRNITLQLLAGILALPLYLEIFIQKGTDTLNSLTFSSIIPALFIPRYIGWLLIVLILIGIYSSIKNKKYDLSVFSIILLMFILIAYRFQFEFFIPYGRALMYLYLILAILFGIGCEIIITLSKNKKIRTLFAIILVVLVLITVLPAKIESNNYIYHIVDSNEVSAFKWIGENTTQNSIAILDPWKANAFTPLAEMRVYSRIMQGPNNISEMKNTEVYAFFQGNCTNMAFLEQNNLSVIYGSCNNSQLNEVYPNVYIR